MRALPLALALAACGGSQPTTKAPPQNASADAGVADAAEVAVLGVLKGDPPPSDPPPSPPRPATPIFDRLRDRDGDVAGLPGFSTRQTRDPRRCGGLAVMTTRSAKVAPENEHLAAVYAMEFPTDLAFSEDKRQETQQKIQAWMQTMTQVAGDASKHYMDQVSSSKDAATRIAAIARLVQIQYRLASMIARSYIPDDIRSHQYAADMTAAFCDQMASIAEPLLTQAEESLAVCIERLASAPKGWWSVVCVK